VNVLRVLSCVVLMMLSATSVQSLCFIGKVTYLSLWQRDAEEGVTALMRAARDGERKNVKALLEQGVDVNVRDPGGWSALTYVDAAYQLLFRPARKDGQPVAYWLPVDIEFQLRRR